MKMARPKTINEDTKNLNFRAEYSLIDRMNEISEHKNDGSLINTLRRLVNTEYEKVFENKKRVARRKAKKAVKK